MKVNAVLAYRNENVFYGGQITHDQVLFFRSENEVAIEYLAKEITQGLFESCSSCQM